MLFFLCFDFHRQPRLKFDHQLLIVDRNLLDKPPRQLLAVFGNRLCLFIQKCDQTLDTLLMVVLQSRLGENILTFLPKTDDCVANLID